ncbi:hypothetical protein [Variovorax sp. 160MFSha2.1]|uniref:hypothetical protein n=1 Tax=Variovorax sp. 160MFSha2.1 TaxID=3158367 RepID=UPI003AABD89C
MNFGQVEAAATALTDLINRDLGRDAIKPMTLETPQPPPDELHLIRLVVWCYGFFYEAAADVLKECKALMKQGVPERTNRYDAGTRTISNLRTYKVHNLPPSKNNDRKREAAQTWLKEFSTGTEGMELASQRLCEMALAVIEDVSFIWKAATKDPDDASQLIRVVKAALDNSWAVHELHQMAREAADEIQLSGFDPKTFCEGYIEEWRQVGSCFLDRASGAIGIRRAIGITMRGVFGPGT